MLTLAFDDNVCDCVNELIEILSFREWVIVDEHVHDEQWATLTQGWRVPSTNHHFGTF